MDSIYNFNNKSDEISKKINLDELYEKKKDHDQFTLNSYNKILTRVHNKIKYTSRQYIDNNFCWYIIPEVFIGIPKYDHRDCTAYIINELQENGFIIRYIHPNLLFISWNHWVPQYVRNEIKKKTGIEINGFGEKINNNADLNNSNNNISNDNKLQNNDSIILNIKDKNNNNSNSNVKNNNYKNIKDYKPEGKLIYDNDLLKNLVIK